jgi:cathepsin L
VKAHNAKLDRLWEAVAGRFADYTEAERSAMRGYRRSPGTVGPASGGAELPAAAVRERELLRPTQGNATLPKKFDWLNLTVALKVPDQGQCGSCWAVTAKAVLDAHYEIYVAKGGPTRNFSAQQIVTCVPNPRACGGTGGCAGATVELAFDWVLHNGCADEQHVPYKGEDLTAHKAKCNDSKALSLPSDAGLYRTKYSPAHGPSESATPAMGGTAFGMHGFHMLERNKERDLIMALYQHGPVATSTAAGAWFEYSKGIFDDCPKDVIVDHAVTLYGYGEEHVHAQPLMPVLTKSNGDVSEPLEPQSHMKKYWLIRNSWGKEWGENGFIRMLRLGHDGHCGEDSDNSQGTGCKGDPKTVTVCGMCGFLWDSVVPHFHLPVSTGSSSGLAETEAIELDPSGKLLRRE